MVFLLRLKRFLHRFQLVVIFLLICLGLIFEFGFVVVIVKVDLLINGSVSKYNHCSDNLLSLITFSAFCNFVFLFSLLSLAFFFGFLGFQKCFCWLQLQANLIINKKYNCCCCCVFCTKHPQLYESRFFAAHFAVSCFFFTRLLLQ